MEINISEFSFFLLCVHFFPIVLNLLEKWRPRRTIIFCSWGAEEYGLIGSTEWIEVLEIVSDIKQNYDLKMQMIALLFVQCTF